jgi:iron complex outermembrane receptor protein
MRKSKSRALASAAAVVSAMLVVPAFAQQAAPQPVAETPDRPQAGPSTNGIDDIIVTARKRQESILNVPVMETAITQARIEQHGILSVADLPSQVTGLVMGNGTSGFGQQVSIHGIGNTAQSSSIDQDVALNIDGVQINQGLAYQAGLFDVQQVEVLKGPQALFFGKNSPGGVISLRSNDPGDHFEAMLRAGYEFEALQKHVEGFVSGPVTDTLGLRLAASYNDQEGYFFNNARPSLVAATFPGGTDPRFARYAPQRDLILRGTLVWKPDSAFSARLKVNYASSYTDGAGGEYQLTDCPQGLTSPSGFPIPFLIGAECKLDRTITISELDPKYLPGVEKGGQLFIDSKQAFGSLELNYQLSPHLNLTSVTGYYRLVHKHQADGTNTTIPAFNAFQYLTRRDITEEVRLQSDYAGLFNFALGGFYQDGKVHDQFKIVTNSGIGFPIPVLEDAYSELGIKSVSGFVQGRLSLARNLDVTAGLRYTHEERTLRTHLNSFDYFAFCCGTPAAPVIDDLVLAVPRISSDNASPEVNVTYHPSGNTTLFATYKQGYKSGSFNTGPSYANTDQSYGDEKVNAFEGGFKGRLFGRQLAINLFGYYYDYQNLQVGALSKANLGSFAFRTLNAASAKIKGIDFDLTYRPDAVPGLSLNAAVNYNHARFGKFDNAPCYTGQTIALGCNGNFNPTALDPRTGSTTVYVDPTGFTGLYTTQDLSGQPLVRAPDWSGTFGFDYETEVGHGLRLTLGSSTYFSSEFYTAPQKKASVIQKGFVKTNANIALSGNGGAWEIALIGTNLTDKITAGDSSVSNVTGAALFVPSISGGTISGPDGIGETISRAEVGRAIWLRFTYRLGQK